MDVRGAAVMVTCPRCGAMSPPTGERLVSCASCRLGFTPHELVAPVRRALASTERRVTSRRSPTRVAIRIAGQGWLGLVPLALGALGVVLAGFVDGQLLRFAQVVLGLAVFAFGLILLDARVIVVDHRFIEARRRPLGFWRERVARRTCAQLDVVADGEHHRIRALGRDGGDRVLFAVRDEATAREVLRALEEALREVPVDDWVVEPVR